MLCTKGVIKSGTYAHGVPVKQKHKKRRKQDTSRNPKLTYTNCKEQGGSSSNSFDSYRGGIFSMTPVARYFQSDCECYAPSPHCVSETGSQVTRPKSLFATVCDTYVTVPPRTVFVN